MKKIFLKCVLMIFISVVFWGCGSAPVSKSSNGLFDDIYTRAKIGNYQDATAALIMLSNMDLSIEEISKIESEYLNEKDEEKRLYYAYILAKRAQGQEYYDWFINSAAKNKELIIKNDSRWVSIVNPLYEFLDYCTSDSDKALAVVLRLVEDADGVVLLTISEDLHDMYNSDPERLIRVANEENFDINKIKLLFEGE